MRHCGVLFGMLAGVLVAPPAGARAAAVQVDDMGVMRGLLDSDYERVVEILEGWNQILIRDAETHAPEDAAGLRRKLQLPETLPEINTLALGDANYGRGLVAVLFERELSVEQVNLLFCADRVGSVQVLFDDSLTSGDTAQLFSRLYGMGPAVPFGSHRPAFRYPLPGVAYDDDGGWRLEVGASPVTIWDMGTREAVYQPVDPRGRVTGQFWLTSREQAPECARAPQKTDVD